MVLACRKLVSAVILLQVAMLATDAAASCFGVSLVQTQAERLGPTIVELEAALDKEFAAFQATENLVTKLRYRLELGPVADRSRIRFELDEVLYRYLRQFHRVVQFRIPLLEARVAAQSDLSAAKQSPFIRMQQNANRDRIISYVDQSIGQCEAIFENIALVSDNHFQMIRKFLNDRGADIPEGSVEDLAGIAHLINQYPVLTRDRTFLEEYAELVRDADETLQILLQMKSKLHRTPNN